MYWGETVPHVLSDIATRRRRLSSALRQTSRCSSADIRDQFAISFSARPQPRQTPSVSSVQTLVHGEDTVGGGGCSMMIGARARALR
jgi:hypothetical protein